MNTKVLFSALCLLVSISVCAGSKKNAKSDSSTIQTKVVKVEDGNVVVVNTTESGKKCSTSVTVTRNGNEKRNNVYVVKSDVKSDSKTTIATSIEAEVKPELPVLAPDSMPEFPGGMSAMMTYLMDNVKYPADAKKDKKEGRVACSFVITKEGKVTAPFQINTVGIYLYRLLILPYKYGTVHASPRKRTCICVLRSQGIPPITKISTECADFFCFLYPLGFER